MHSVDMISFTFLLNEDGDVYVALGWVVSHHIDSLYTLGAVHHWGITVSTYYFFFFFCYFNIILSPYLILICKLERFLIHISAIHSYAQYVQRNPHCSKLEV